MKWMGISYINGLGHRNLAVLIILIHLINIGEINLVLPWSTLPG